MKHSKILLSLLTVVLATSFHVRAENWPQWRGLQFNGASSETGLPTEFSKTKNVLWSADMPGPSSATPVIWKDKVFVSTTDQETKTLWAMCLDRRTGKTLWKHQTGVGFARDDRSNFASPSPVTDGNHVIFFYGTGDLAGFDMDGKKVWDRNIQTDYGQFAFLWTFSSSPTLYDGKLYMQVLQRNTPVQGRGQQGAESYILALEPATGKELWKQIRPSEARSESLEAFSTPIPFVHQGRAELLVIGGDDITGHDPKTGKELWRWGTWNPSRITHWRLVPSPVTGGGVILACGPKDSFIYAVKAGLSGTQDDSALAWTTSGNREVASDVSTPLFYQGHFYILNSDRRTLSCVEPATGKVLWTGQTGSRHKFEASPTGADGKIYVMDFSGDVYVFQAGKEFKILAVNSMGEERANHLRSSIPVSQGNLFVRTHTKLYCIGSSSN
jgi:outer membrane protein assembly factor BamB